MRPSITLAAVSHMSQNKIYAYQLANSSREAATGKKVGAGGAHWLMTEFLDDAVAGELVQLSVNNFKMNSCRRG